MQILPGITLGPKSTTSTLKSQSCCQLNKSHQKFDIVLENKVVKKLRLSKIINNKKCAPKMIFLNEGQVNKIHQMLDK